jgi:protein-S-isoprenylcysteine O-methyltransferase Ste14
VQLFAAVGIGACWGAFALTWLVGALYTATRGPAKRVRTPFGAVVPVVAIIEWVIFRTVPHADWMTVHTPWLRVLGAAILVACTAFTLWARVALGIMWSSDPMVKENHELRTNGPYGITRHPIYTGMLGMLLGTSLLAGLGAWAPLFPLAVVFFEIKIHLEEGLMMATFREDYPHYRQHVPQLVPGLHRTGRTTRFTVNRRAGNGLQAPVRGIDRTAKRSVDTDCGRASSTSDGATD